MSAGGIIGAIVGFLVGGPVGGLRGFQLGSMAQSLLDPPSGPNVQVQGPRLSDLTTQTATYGAVIPRVYGTAPVSGNVFWLENNRLKEVATTTTTSQDGKGGGGGGSTTTTTYAYYATFAVGLCEGPIAGVRRIWIGPKLIYDAGTADIATLSASNKAAKGFKVYLGTDTQTADPRIQAKLGIANTPAYRGLAYIVFYDLAMAAWGNSLAGAQVRVEIVSAQTAVTGGRILSSTGSAYATRGMAVTSYADGVITGYGVSSSGASQYVDQAVVAPSGVVSIPRSSHIPLSGGTGFFTMTVQGNPGLIIALTNFAGSTLAWIDRTGSEFGSRISMANAPVYSWAGGSSPAAYHAPSNNLMMIGVDSSGSTRFYCATSIGSGAWEVSIPAASAPLNFGSLICHYDGNVYATVGTTLIYQVDNAFNALAGPWVYPNGLQFLCRDGRYFYFQSTAIALNHSIYELEFDGANYTLGNPKIVSLGGSMGAFACLGGRVLWVNTSSGSKFIGFGDVITPQSMTLDSVVSAEVLKSALLTAGDIDVTSLTPDVRGYRVTGVAPIRASLSPLQAIWPFDVVQSGYKVKFVKRGLSPVATIAAGQLDARGAGVAASPRITCSREMDLQIPRKVVINYLDVDREYNQSSQYDERLNTDAINVLTVDTPVILNTAGAAGAAQTLLYLHWLERLDFTGLRLPPTFNHLEPCDVITVVGDSATYELRLTAVNYTSDGRLECTAKLNNAATYTPTATGEGGTAADSLIQVDGPAFTELLDIPLLADDANKAGFPVAMAGIFSGWPGGVLYRTDDGGQTWINVKAFDSVGPAIGATTNTIAAHPGTMIDRASVLNVSLQNGSLASVTDVQMLNGANLFAYGSHGRWEIIAAQNCVLQGDGSYKLSDLLRGRFGTEWATGTHQIGDRLIEASAALLPFVSVNSSVIGQARTYRGVTIGQSISAGEDFTWTYAGVNLECLSPVYLNGSRHPTTNDWTLNWVRRTRIGGEWRDWVDATLGETSEAYQVEIYSNSSYVQVLRTLSVATASAAYTSAQQVADFGSNQATLYVRVTQVSSLVGPGYPLTTSITR